MKRVMLLSVCFVFFLASSCADKSNIFIYTDGDQQVIIELPKGQKNILADQENELRVTFKNIDRKTATFTTNGIKIKGTEGDNVSLITLEPTNRQKLTEEVVFTLAYDKEGQKVYKTIRMPVI